MGLGASQPQTPASTPSKVLGTPEYFFRNVENHPLTCSILRVLQNFACISAEQPASFTPNRTEEDKEDPDPFRTTPVHATDSSRNMGSGNSFAFPSSRTRADESGSEEHDCVILEVLDPLPISTRSPRRRFQLIRVARCWRIPCHFLPSLERLRLLESRRLLQLVLVLAACQAPSAGRFLAPVLHGRRSRKLFRPLPGKLC
jgi:hypothetical protein